MNKYLDIFNKWKEKKEFGRWSHLKNDHAITCIYGINVESVWHAHFHGMVFFLYALYFHWDLQCRLTWTLKTTKTSQPICCYILKYMLKFQSFSNAFRFHIRSDIFERVIQKGRILINFSHAHVKRIFFNQLLAVA